MLWNIIKFNYNITLMKNINKHENEKSEYFAEKEIFSYKIK